MNVLSFWNTCLVIEIMGKYYDNILLLAPDGTNLGFINNKRAKKFLEWGIVVWQEDKVLRMTREPTGYVVRHQSMLVPRKDICTVCGTDKDGSFHHIVPYCYRRCFDEAYKTHNSYDVVLLCDEHHRQYEKVASAFKTKIAERYGVVSDQHPDSTMQYLRKVRGAAVSLLMGGDKIPDDRKERLLKAVREHLKKEEITEDDLKQLIKMKCNDRRLTSSYAVMQKVIAEKSIEDFVVEWRKHFMETMKPQFMPEYWEIEKVVR
jgi:exonuclease 3'-5' domain-containing protein 2